jgi:hypothetical protein
MKYTLRSKVTQSNGRRRPIPALAGATRVLAIRNLNGRSSDGRPT